MIFTESGTIFDRFAHISCLDPENVACHYAHFYLFILSTVVMDTDLLYIVSYLKKTIIKLLYP